MSNRNPMTIEELRELNPTIESQIVLTSVFGAKYSFYHVTSYGIARCVDFTTISAFSFDDNELRRLFLSIEPPADHKLSRTNMIE